VPAADAPSIAAAPPAGGGGLGEHQAPLPEIGRGSGDPVGPVGGGSGSSGGSMPGETSSNPEPGTVALVGTGLIGLATALRRRRV